MQHIAVTKTVIEIFLKLLALAEIHVKQYPEDASMIEKEVGE